MQHTSVQGGSRRGCEDATPAYLRGSRRGRDSRTAAAVAGRGRSRRQDASRDPRQPRQDASASGCSGGRQATDGREGGK
ncbi:hypothetical protein NDU88_006092 [Pleurodeles waltl]|uniref:Uncharacterized protein n=1 Tax=Pleurodeles waltl TaxID=8319 RepID=A0AAV7QI16_PLEWA|nr:hypothetical protein NDU88_006092 [Pleurodeles waltl]